MSIFSKELSKIAKNGFLGYVKETTGETHTSSRWFATQAKETFGEAATEFIKDPEVQKSGAELVQHTLREGVSTMKTNFSTALQDVKEWTSNKSDTRSTYEKARELLGDNPSDKWYTKIAKSFGAGILSLAVPVASFISTLVATKFTGETAQRPDIFKSFKAIFSGALGLATMPKQTA